MNAVCHHYSAIFHLLETIGGAPASLHDDFVFHHARASDKADEYRFQGKLGFGGKFRRKTNTVDCYKEDENPARLAIIEQLNTILVDYPPCPSEELKTPLTHPDHETVGHCFHGCFGGIYYCDSYDPRIGFWVVELGKPENRKNISERAIGRTYHRCDYSYSPKFMSQETAPVVGVNSCRWICPKCTHINAVCPTALGNVFACTKCHMTAQVVLCATTHLATVGGQEPVSDKDHTEPKND